MKGFLLLNEMLDKQKIHLNKAYEEGYKEGYKDGFHKGWEEVIKKIKVEIQEIIDEERTGNGNINKGVVIGLQMALDTVNKYRAESEG